MSEEVIDLFYPSGLHIRLPGDHLQTEFKENPSLSSSRNIKLNININDLLPGRTLVVTEIGVDRYGLRVQYRVTPPLPSIIGDPRGGMDDDSFQYDWYLAGRDNLGNEYDTGGGGRGLAADGSHTRGIHTLTPVPHADASWLDIAFCLGEAGDQLENARYVLRVLFPLVVHEGNLDKPKADR